MYNKIMNSLYKERQESVAYQFNMLLEDYGNMLDESGYNKYTSHRPGPRNTLLAFEERLQAFYSDVYVPLISELRCHDETEYTKEFLKCEESMEEILNKGLRNFIHNRYPKFTIKPVRVKRKKLVGLKRDNKEIYDDTSLGQWELHGEQKAFADKLIPPKYPGTPDKAYISPYERALNNFRENVEMKKRSVATPPPPRRKVMGGKIEPLMDFTMRMDEWKKETEMYRHEYNEAVKSGNIEAITSAGKKFTQALGRKPIY